MADKQYEEIIRAELQVDSTKAEREIDRLAAKGKEAAKQATPPPVPGGSRSSALAEQIATGQYTAALRTTIADAWKRAGGATFAGMPLGQRIFGGLSGPLPQAAAVAGLGAVVLRASDNFRKASDHFVEATNRMVAGLMTANATNLGVLAPASMMRMRAYAIRGGAVMGGAAIGGGIGALTGAGAVPGAIAGGVVGGLASAPQWAGALIQARLTEKLSQYLDGLVEAVGRYNAAIYGKTREYEYAQVKFMFSLGRWTQGLGTAWMDFKIKILQVWEAALPKLQPLFDALTGYVEGLADGFAKLLPTVLDFGGAMLQALDRIAAFINRPMASLFPNIMAAGDRAGNWMRENVPGASLLISEGGEWHSLKRGEKQPTTLGDIAAGFYNSAAKVRRAQAFVGKNNSELYQIAKGDNAQLATDAQEELKRRNADKLLQSEILDKGNILEQFGLGNLTAKWANLRYWQENYGRRYPGSWAGQMLGNFEKGAWGSRWQFPEAHEFPRELGSPVAREHLSMAASSIKALSGRDGADNLDKKMKERQAAQDRAPWPADQTPTDGQSRRHLKLPGPDWPKIQQNVQLSMEMRLQHEKGVEDAMNMIRQRLVDGLHQVQEDIRVVAAVMDGRNLAALM